jgi:CxxC motif-containing protein
VCPEGCQIAVEGENISGYRCKRGLLYVRQERENPTRNIATTVRLTGGEMPLVPVKTASPIPKDKIFEVMALCRALTVPAPVKKGEVVLPDAAGTGVDMVATADGI